MSSIYSNEIPKIRLSFIANVHDNCSSRLSFLRIHTSATSNIVHEYWLIVLRLKEEMLQELLANFQS